MPIAKPSNGIKIRTNESPFFSNHIYYWFVVRFPIGLNFLFITFLLHFLLPWTSSLSISSSAIIIFGDFNLDTFKSTPFKTNKVDAENFTDILNGFNLFKLIHKPTRIKPPCCCCCLPTPMTLASGGSPMFPLVVHQPTSPSI